ncbi:MAG: hypothetical protein N3E49_07290 [Bacteroidia bacterium]|nr:hypothetical protein [Bacteroidia bacterium]
MSSCAYAQPEDLRKFGLIPEFIGRLPVIAAMEPLNEEALMRILTEPQNAILRQYQQLLAWDGIRLQMTEGALRRIAREALEMRTGARALRTLMETVLEPVLYERPVGQEIVIDEAEVAYRLAPLRRAG